MKRIAIPKSLLPVALILFFLVNGVLPLRAAAGEVIDRIVATVNGHIILQSDWNDALCFEAVLVARPVEQFTDADRRAVLDRLIDQELLGEQMK